MFTAFNEKLKVNKISNLAFPLNAGKFSIISAVTAIISNLCADTFFQERSTGSIIISIFTVFLMAIGIAAAIFGLFKAWKCSGTDAMLLSGAGFLMNSILIAIGFVGLPLSGKFEIGPKAVSAREVQIQQVSKSGHRMITKDWTSGDAIEITDRNFDDVIENSDIPVLVDFWAPWCGPCRMMGPIIEDIAEKYEGKVKVRKLNTDNSRKTPARFNIRGIPTIILFKNGSVKMKWVGVTNKQDICSALDKLL